MTAKKFRELSEAVKSSDGGGRGGGGGMERKAVSLSKDQGRRSPGAEKTFSRVTSCPQCDRKQKLSPEATGQASMSCSSRKIYKTYSLSLSLGFLVSCHLHESVPREIIFWSTTLLILHNRSFMRNCSTPQHKEMLSYEHYLFPPQNL